MESWKTISRELILDHNKFLRVENHVVELPNGRSITDWPWVDTPDYIDVLAETKNGRFLFFRQTKYAIDGTSLAPAGGYLEPGEEPLPAAQRELLEETGYAAPEWHFLGSYAVDGNRGAGTAYFYLARGAEFVTERNADDLEEQELLLLTRDEVETAVAQNQFKVLPWLTAVLLGLRYLDSLASTGDKSSICPTVNDGAG